MPTESPSLKLYSDEQAAKFKAQANVNHPPILPDGVWMCEQGKLKLIDQNTGKPMQLRLHVTEVLGFFSETGKISFSFDLPADADGKPTTEVGRYLSSLFGPDGSLIAAIVENRKDILPAKHKIPGKGPDKDKLLREYLQNDAKMEAGKPNLLPQPLKPRSDDEGNPYLRFGINVYTKKAVGADREREPGTLPPELKEAFKDHPDHPLRLFFESNPGEDPSEPNSSVAAEGDDAVSFWHIIAKLTKKGKKQDYWKAIASLTLGGITVKFNAARGILTCSFYLNGPGLRVYAGIDMSSGEMVAVDPRDEDMYAAAGAMKRRNPDADMYEQAAKRPATEEADGNDEAPAAADA